ncbi:MAG: DUF4129 domain-containing protein [Chloroflexota bacterium]
MKPRKSLLVHSLVLVMEVLAGYALVLGSGLQHAFSTGYTLLWIVLGVGLAGLLLGTMAAVRGGSAERIGPLVLAGGIVASVLPALLIGRDVTSFFLALVLCGLAYWRGLTISQSEPGVDAAQIRFGPGYAMLLVGLVWLLATSRLQHQSTWIVLAVLGVGFTGAAMAAMATARLESVREPAAGRTASLAIALQLGLLILAGLILTRIFSLDLSGAFFRATHPVWDALASALLYVLSIVAMPIQGAVNLLMHHTHLPRIKVPVSGYHKPPKPLVVRSHGVTSNVPALAAAAVLVTAVVAGVLALISRTVLRTRKRVPELDSGDERHSVLRSGSLWRAIWQYLIHLVRGSPNTTRRRITGTRRRLFGAYPGDAIRRMYVQLLRRSSAAGLSRSPSTTPAEFQQELAARWPDSGGHFAALTEAYTVRRYGDVALDDAELQHARHHWQAIRSEIHPPARIHRARDAQAQSTVPGDRSFFPLRVWHAVTKRIRKSPPR